MKNGVHKNLTIDDYHANDTHISSTQIKRAKRSLSEYWYYEWHEKERKSHFDFGNAFECALIEPEKFDTEVHIFDVEDRPEHDKGITSKINQEWKKGILNSDKYVINKEGKESFETIAAMLESCKKDATIQTLLQNTEYQTSVFWTDPTTGLQLKARPDICKRKKRVIVDVKTTRDGSPEAFSKDLANFDYPLQACLQMRGCIEAGLMEEVDAFFWLVVEKEPPFNATIYEFDKEDILFCMDSLDFVLSRIAKAQKEEKYIGYTDRSDNKHGILTADLPLWYRK